MPSYSTNNPHKLITITHFLILFYINFHMHFSIVLNLILNLPQEKPSKDVKDLEAELTRIIQEKNNAVRDESYKRVSVHPYNYFP